MKKSVYVFISTALIFIVCQFFLENTQKVYSLYSDDSSTMLAIAHRGASAYAPENTIPAYELASMYGSDYIELDIHMTKDNILVAFHDNTVDRVTLTSGEIHSLSLQEIKQLNPSAYFQHDDWFYENHSTIEIPTLDEIFEHFGDRVNYLIELKNPDKYENMEALLIELLHRYQLLEKTDERGFPKVIVQSFYPNSLKTIHELEPTIPLLQLYSRAKTPYFSQALINEVQTYAVGIGAHYSMLTQYEIMLLKSHGLLVFVYTINDLHTMQKYKSYGVDGIVTDYIDLLVGINH